MNRDTKSKEGIVGFSVNKGIVQCCLLTSHKRAAISEACRDMAGLTTTDDNAIKEMENSRMAVDENDVKKVCTTVINWRNLFCSSESEKNLPHCIRKNRIQDLGR